MSSYSTDYENQQILVFCDNCLPWGNIPQNSTTTLSRNNTKHKYNCWYLSKIQHQKSWYPWLSARLLPHWSYCSLLLSHHYILPSYLIESVPSFLAFVLSDQPHFGQSLDVGMAALQTRKGKSIFKYLSFEWGMIYLILLKNLMRLELLFNRVFCSPVHLDWQQRNIKGPYFCPFESGIHPWLLDSLHQGTVTWKMEGHGPFY